eukprot:5281563-Amphidinium_carterae.1
MQQTPIERFKAFLDVSVEDSKAYARYGASSFQKHQLRLVTSNSLNRSAEPMAIDANAMSDIPHEQFLDMIKPSWEEGANIVDIMACLKRAHAIIIGKNACYVCPANERECPVKVVPWVPG